MEAHYEPKHEKKNWKDYLIDLVMMFIAISLGFGAENIREGYQDRHRVNAFMCKISYDLKADIDQIANLKNERIKRIAQCDSLITMLSSNPAKGDRNKIYQLGRYATRRIHFRPQNATLQQLKNTGDLRLVKFNEVLDAINHYEQELKYNDENVLVEEKELSEISQLSSRIFDAAVFQKMKIDTNIEPPAGNPNLISYDKALLNEISVKLHYWKRTSVSVLENFDEMKKDAENLLKLTTENYRCSEKKK
jgi:hypothetical protein